MYTRFSPKKRSIAGYSQLWVAEDHLLLVKSSRFFEEYRRFAFKDIQAIVLRQTGKQSAVLIVYTLFALVLLTVALSLNLFASTAGTIAWAVFAIPDALLLLNEWLKGPRCTCELQTAVSKEKLPPVLRMRSGAGLVARLRERIEQVQGRLDFGAPPLPAPDLGEPGPPPVEA